jgi:hypothetical protein
MDAADCFSTAQNFYPRAPEFHGEAVRRIARTLDWRDASQIGAASVAQITDGFVRQRVKTAGRYVLLKLFVPRFRVKLREPASESRQFIRRKFADSSFDFFYRAHAIKFVQNQWKCKRKLRGNLLRESGHDFAGAPITLAAQNGKW